MFASVVRAVGADARRTAAAASHQVEMWPYNHPLPGGWVRRGGHRAFSTAHEARGAAHAARIQRVADGELAELARLRDVLPRWAGERPGGARTWAETEAWILGKAPSVEAAMAARRHAGPRRAPTPEARAVALREAQVVERAFLAPVALALHRHDYGENLAARTQREKTQWFYGVGREIDRRARTARLAQHPPAMLKAARAAQRRNAVVAAGVERHDAGDLQVPEGSGLPGSAPRYGFSK